jgi:transposase
MVMLDNISGAVKEEKIYLFLDNASFHKNEEVRKHMKELNIEPIFNVSYQFQYNPIERLWGQYKQYFRKVLLDKMLANPDQKANPLKDSVFETFS